MNAPNHYELLGVGPHVGAGQIQAAYRFARSLYTGESTPTYGLLDADERASMLARVEKAYDVLSNPISRRDYDVAVAAQGAPPRASAPAAREQPETGKRTMVAPTPPEKTSKPVVVPDYVNGAALRALREARGLSVDQIAAMSKVGGRFLKALEEDRHEALPGRVFARGFLIEYARAIGASESEIVDRYLRNWTGK